MEQRDLRYGDTWHATRIKKLNKRGWPMYKVIGMDLGGLYDMAIREEEKIYSKVHISTVLKELKEEALENGRINEVDPAEIARLDLARRKAQRSQAPDKQTLRYLYVNKKHSQKEIAELYDVACNTVGKWLKNAKIYHSNPSFSDKR